MKTTIGNQSIVKQNIEELLASDLDEEIIFMNLDSGDYIGINDVGATIWKLIEQPRSVEDIVQHLLEEYEVERSICEEKTIEFLLLLQTENMLEIV